MSIVKLIMGVIYNILDSRAPFALLLQCDGDAQTGRGGVA